MSLTNTTILTAILGLTAVSNFVFANTQSINALSAGQNNNCQVSMTRVAPYYTTHATMVETENFDFLTAGLRSVYSKTDDHITTETFRDFKKSPKGRISKNTLVRLQLNYYKDLEKGLIEVASIESNTGKKFYYIPIEVVTPEKIYFRLKTDKEQKMFVNPGDKGLLAHKSLNPVDETVSLIVSKNMTLSTGEYVERGSVLTPFTSREAGFGNYATLVCNNKRYYPFEVQNFDKNIVDVIYLNPELDGENMSPIVKEHLQGVLDVKKALKSFYNADVNLDQIDVNYQGFVRLPMINEVDTTGISGTAYDNSFVHYQGGDPFKSDTWGKSNTICGIMKLAQDWQKTCKGQGCTLQIGDLAFATGAIAMNSKAKKLFPYDPLMHQTHFNGTCVDLRAIRKDDKFDPVYVSTQKKSAYDRAKTLEFIKYAEKNFALSTIIFGDRKVVKQVDDALFDSGHKDHVHICFPEATTVETDFCSL